ncbi:MAG TPA: response regulator, partial [Anaeromyxobacteraceae bacterium]|nr:response regulator [Anaeromyxobacteraceae bacterium]
MSKTILLIENDAAFAGEITEALEGAGFQVRATGDGKEGLDLAKEASPDAIVLCVELPRMSGYSICQKLKKEEGLRSIPLVLTSAEATAETFEAHRKLKARAEEYLLKPYTAQALLDVLAPHVGRPAPQEAGGEGDEEVVSLEEDLDLEALGGETDGELPPLDLASLPDEPMAGGAAGPAGEDEDLQLLDDAFQGLSAPAAPAARAALGLDAERPVSVEDLDAAADSLPEEDEAPEHDALGALSQGADDALDALGGDDPMAALDALAAPEDEPRPSPSLDLEPELAAALDLEPEPSSSRPIRGASAEALRAAGISLLGTPPSPPPAPANVLHLVPPPSAAPGAGAGELARLEADLAERRAAVAARDAEIAELSERVDEL